MSNEQKVLLNRIQVCEFVLLETSLFLDTHPENKEALEYFKKYNTLSRQATDEYITKYGPLNTHDYMGGPRWNWVDGPWPWEREDN